LPAVKLNCAYLTDVINVFGGKMNKFAALLAAGMLLSGCVYNSKVSTGAEQL
jgi:hypothetical protein